MFCRLFLFLLALLSMCSPAYAKDRVGVSTSTTVASIDSTGYDVLSCTGTPAGVELGLAHLQLSSISSATEIVWFLAWDSALDEGFTLEKTDTIITGKTTSTDGWVQQSLENMPYVDQSGNGTIYVGVKTNSAGTVSASCRIFWKESR